MMPNRPLPFTLVQIQYFTEIAKRENMTAAADRLQVTQPTLSAAMKQLEKTLNATLFIRTEQNRLKLTAAGRALLVDAERLMKVAGLVGEHARSEGGEIVGGLVVGVFSPIAPFRVPNILREYSQLHPQVTLSFVDGNQSSLQRMLLDGTCDVVIMYRLDLDPRIQTTVLDRASPYVLLPKDHVLAKESTDVKLEELRGEPYIMLDLPHTREYYLGVFAWGGIEPMVRYHVDSFESVRSFVGSGQGYTILHQGRELTHTYSGGEVVSRNLHGDPPHLEIVLGAMSEVLQTRRLREFLRIARTVFARNPS